MHIGYDGRILAGPLRGMARYTVELLRALGQVAPQNTYSLYTDRPLQIAVPDHVRVRQLASGRFWASRRLPGSLKADGVDLIHFPSNTCWLYPALPTVVTLHDVNPLISRRFGWKTRSHYYAYLSVMTYAARAIITDSEASAQTIGSVWPFIRQSRIYPILLGIHADLPDVSDSPLLDNDYILFVGGCDPNKNLLTVVQALRQIDEIHLVVVGACKPSDYTSAVQNAVAAANLDHRVHFLDRVEDNTLNNLYHHARMLVFPSFREGFGFPILEAMRHGTPVITSNATSMPEVAGDAALLFAPQDHDTLVTHMRRLLSEQSLVQVLKTQGAARVQAFSWARTAQQTLEIYEKVLDRA